MKKQDIINLMAPAHGQGSYLEICTPSTGCRFDQIDPARFATRHRLMYRCPESYDDGLDLTFRTSADSPHELIRTLLALQRPGEGYDVVFVDPWHASGVGFSDMHGGLCLLAATGVMVVHDCNPPDEVSAAAEFHEGAWCGDTYQSFVEFILGAGVASYCVVDCDFGCGVVFGPDRPLPAALAHRRPGQRMVYDWHLTRGTDLRYRFFDRNRTTLLNLMSPSKFLDTLDLPYPDPAPATALPDLSQPPTGPDRSLTVLVADAPLLLDRYEGGWHRFRLPPATRNVHLVSPTYVPHQQNPDVPDRRALGVAVAGIKLGQLSIDLADYVLAEGWHCEEAQAGYPWRWTDGNARLCVPDGTETLEVFTTFRGSSPT